MNLTKEELLAQAEPSRQHSPIIEALCAELEKSFPQELTRCFECPVCEATLKVDLGEEDQLNVEVQTQ